MIRRGRLLIGLAVTALGLAGIAWGGADRSLDTYPNVEIETATLDGHVTRLTTNPALDTSPAVSPNGRSIAFVSSRGGPLGLYVMRSDGSHVQPVMTSPFTAGPASIGTSEVAWNDAGHTFIAWRPDGGMLAFDGQNATFDPSCTHNCTDWRIFLVKPNGSALHFVSQESESPSWSPAGGRLAFVSQISPDLEGSSVTILTVSSGTTVVVHAPSFNTFEPPAWSRTGLLAIETLTGEARPQRIATVRANGTRLRKLVVGEEPSWSPNGTRLAFVRNDRLYTIGAAGGAAIQLTKPPEHASLPAWSPNGTWIAYLRSVGKRGQTQLAVIRAAGGGERVLTHVPKGDVFDTRPVWTPDSGKVVFTLWRPKRA